jgi:hypothetical protein
VSGQLYAEMLACSLSRVYTFGPTFRAEQSNTTRHLNEFWMIEPEMAHADLDTIIALAERFVKYVLRALLKNCDDGEHKHATINARGVKNSLCSAPLFLPCCFCVQTFVISKVAWILLCCQPCRRHWTHLSRG